MSTKDASSDDGGHPFTRKSIPLPPRLVAMRESQSPDTSADLHTFETGDSLKEQYKLEGGSSSTAALSSGQSDDDRDAEVLRRLGYDALLGRQLNFWSSLGINVCNMCFMFDWTTYSVVHTLASPKLFLIGFPVFSGLFHFALLFPAAEFASAWPVAGAMATWAWRLARGGIRGERKWGWLMTGFVLGAHLGKVLGGLFVTVIACVDVMYFYTGAPPPTPPEKWPAPVWQIGLVTLVTIFVITRLGRTHQFWVVGLGLGVLNVVMLAGMEIACLVKSRPYGPKVLGYPTQPLWTRSWAYMMFANLPMKMTPMDAAAHMAEETKNPARNVPRAIIISYIFHFIATYTLVAMYIFINPDMPPSYALGIPLGKRLNIPVPAMGIILTLTLIFCIFQFTSSVIITSRFIFAMARDRAIPFSNVFVKTNKHKEPWVANLTIICILYISVFTWFVDFNNYWILVTAFNFVLPPVIYLIPLGLYLASRMNLSLEGRIQFSVGRWSRPLALAASLWLLLVIIQGSLPGGAAGLGPGPSGKVETPLSFFPYVMAGMLVIMFVSWWMYGRKYYVGPLTSLMGGAVNTNASAVQQYLGRGSGSSGGKKGILSRLSAPKSWFTKTRHADGDVDLSVLPDSAVLPSSAANRNPAQPSVSVLPESGIFPKSVAPEASVVPESGIFPDQSVQTESQLLPETGSRVNKSNRIPIPPFGIQTISEHGDYEVRSHAQQESQLMPEQSVVQQESQVLPQDSFTTSQAQQESQLLPDDRALRRLSASQGPRPPPRGRRW